MTDTEFQARLAELIKRRDAAIERARVRFNAAYQALLKESEAAPNDP